MAAKNQNFEMFAGETKRIFVSIPNANLMGATVKWAMKKTIFNPEPDVFKSTEAGVSITDDSVGEFTILLTPTDTEALSGSYYHEAKITDSSGNVSTILTGTVTVHLSGV